MLKETRHLQIYCCARASFGSRAELLSGPAADGCLIGGDAGGAEANEVCRVGVVVGGVVAGSEVGIPKKIVGAELGWAAGASA
jgi:hypothetical protein